MTVKEMQARANARPDRAATLAKRRAVLATMGDPAKVSDDARAQLRRMAQLSR